MKRKNKGLAGFYTENKALVWAGGFGFGFAIIYGIYRVTSKGGAANVGKQNISSASMNSTSTQTPATTTYTNTSANNAGYTTTTTNTGFPLKVGSKGATVKEMQQYLIDIAGTKRILPASGADGDFGSGTLKALNTYFGVSEVTEAQFEILKRASPMWWDSASNTGMFQNFRETVIKKGFPNFNKIALLNIDKQAR